MENIFTKTLMLNKKQLKRFKEVLIFLEWWQNNTGKAVNDFQEILKLANFKISKRGHLSPFILTCEKSKNNGKTYWSLTRME